MDKIANMLTAIMNAGQVKKSAVVVPYSNFTAAVAHKLFELEYISGHRKVTEGKRTMIQIDVKYTTSGTPRITGAKRVSKLSKRVYRGVRDLYKVKQGHGDLILSTPKGIKTSAEAYKERVGGELLFEIW